MDTLQHIIIIYSTNSSEDEVINKLYNELTRATESQYPIIIVYFNARIGKLTKQLTEILHIIKRKIKMVYY